VPVDSLGAAPNRPVSWQKSEKLDVLSVLGQVMNSQYRE